MVHPKITIILLAIKKIDRKLKKEKILACGMSETQEKLNSITFLDFL
jgi:hypothetical protein